MSEQLPFVNEQEQARIDALPEDVRVPVIDLMEQMHKMRPDLNQPGMFDDWLSAVEKAYTALP